MAKKYGFTVFVQAKGVYDIARINVLSFAYPTIIHDPLFTLNYQRGSDDSPNAGEWYGFNVKIKAKYINQIQEASRLLTRLDKAIESQWGDMAKVVAALRKVATEGVYDHRESEFVPIEEAKPHTWQRYMACDTEGQCIHSVVAPNEETALNGLIEKAARSIQRGGYSKNRSAEWLSRLDVEIDHYSTMKEEDFQVAEVKLGLQEAEATY